MINFIWLTSSPNILSYITFYTMIHATHCPGSFTSTLNLTYPYRYTCKGRELNSATTLASQPAAGHRLSFIIIIVIYDLGLRPVCGAGRRKAEFCSHAIDISEFYSPHLRPSVNIEPTCSLEITDVFTVMLVHYQNDLCQ